MKNNWEKHLLEDVLVISGGGTPSTKNPEYWNGNIPFLVPTDVTNQKCKYIEKTANYITDLGLKKSSAKINPVGSVLLTSRATIGECVINKIPMATNQGFINILTKKDKVDAQYFFYWVKNNRDYLISLGRGAVYLELVKSVFKKIEIELPPFPIQQKISSILSDYDDLIDVNERKIKILEDMAKLIYKEWFVKFRFPGYEKVKMVESEIEMVPEGWEVRSILDVEGVNLIKAKVKRYDGVKEYFATANVEGNNIIKAGEMVTYDEKPSRAQMQPEENTIWFAKMRETFKVLCFTLANKKKAENSILSTGFAGLKVSKDILGFIYFTVNSKKFHVLKDQYCTGATQMSSTIEGLSLIKIVLPDKNLVRAYSELTQPMIDQIIRLQQQNQLLRQTRDMLLPKLISGEIEV